MRQWIDLFEKQKIMLFEQATRMSIEDLPFQTKQEIITMLLENCPPFEKYWMEYESIMTFNETYVSQFIFGYEIEYHPEGDGTNDDNWFPVDIFDLDPQSIDNTNRSVSDNVVAQYTALKTVPPPILVKRQGNGWKIVEGGHRLAAAKQNGTKSIKAVDVTVFFQTDFASLGNLTESLDSNGVRAWAAEVESRLGLKSFDVWLNQHGDLKLNLLVVDRSAQKQGTGTAAMRELLAYADRLGKRVVLSPATKDDHHGTTSRTRLIRFYKTFGFKENKGQRKDFTVSDSLIREPKSKLEENTRLDEYTPPREPEMLNTLLQDRGWERIGEGNFATVYNKPGMNYVLKVFEYDSAYRAFLKLAAASPNPHFPKIIGSVRVTEKYTAVRMEKLLPQDRITVDGYSVLPGTILTAYLINHRISPRDRSHLLRNLELANSYLADKPALVQALDLIRDKLLDNFQLDLNHANLMSRSDGTLVITDPVYY